MECNIILAGVGGQGILTIAEAVSRAAMHRNWSIKQAEVHGMSQRGGSVQSHLRISDRPLHSDLVERGTADVILAIEPLESLRYVEYLREDGAIVTNTTAYVNMSDYPAIEKVLDRITGFSRHVVLDADRWAKSAGSARAVNAAMLGAAMRFLPFDAAELERSLGEMFSSKGTRVVEANARALRFGDQVATRYLDLLGRGIAPRAARQRIEELSASELVDGSSFSANAEAKSAWEEGELSDHATQAVKQVLESMAREGRKQLFEHEVYSIVELVGAIKPPRHRFVPVGESIESDALAKFAGERVVLKIVSPDVIHKSDVGGVLFVARTADAVTTEMESLIRRHTASGAHVVGVLIVEFVERGEVGFGQELFVGLRATREFGAVLAAGLGGVDTEYLAHQMKPGMAVAKALVEETTADEFFALFRRTAAYDVMAGQARGHRRVVSDGELLRCFRAFLMLGRRFCAADCDPAIEELEVNPFAFSRQRLVPLDGRGRAGESVRPAIARSPEHIRQMLEPRSVAVLGVSSSRENFGRIILANTLECGFPKEHLYVIKSDPAEIDGVRCVPTVADLPEPVDLLIVAAASFGLVPVLRDAIESARIASIILIPGGVGETSGSESLQEQLREMLTQGRRGGRGAPVVLGGNCLGVRSHPGRYDTFFVPRSKFPLRTTREVSRFALITQSGGFAITRLSNLEHLPPALAVTIGNQLDITASDVLTVVAQRDDVDVIGVYMEGFRELDGLAFVRAVEDAARRGKVVVFYKAGRTESGRAATAGHTASVAGDYDVCQTAVAQSGAIVVDTFKEFEQVVELCTLFHDVRVRGRGLAAISNAGFETVGMADTLRGARYELQIAAPTEATLVRIRQIAEASGLGNLVNVRNPLDLNPMADEKVYEECAEAMLLDEGVDALVVSVVPFTSRLRTTPEELAGGGGSLVERLAGLRRRHEKPIIVVIDAGRPYDTLSRALREAGVPVFPSCDQAIRSLGRFLCHRASPRPLSSSARMLRSNAGRVERSEFGFSRDTAACS